MADYRFLLGDINPASGNGLREEIRFSTIKYSHVLNRPGGFEATLRLDDPKATRANLDPGRTAIHVERGGLIDWSGICWLGAADTDKRTLRVAGQGWWSYFRGPDNRRGRYLRHTKTYAAVDQFEIAQDLINYAQAQPGGDIGVTVGTETSGVTRDQTWYHYERKNIGLTVEQLAERANGFDFGIDVAYDSGGTIVKTLRFWNRRGRVTPLRWWLGTNLEGLSQTVDASTSANLVDALGAGEGEDILIQTASDPSQLAAYPLREDVVTHKDVSQPGTLQAKASMALAAGRRPLSTAGPVLARQAHPDTELGGWALGDTINVRGADGWIDVDQALRIVAYEVSIAEDGRETVSVTLVPEDTTLVA